MEVMVFRSAIAARDDHEIVLAFFNATQECVAILKGSEEVARALMETLGSTLTDDKTR